MRHNYIIIPVIGCITGIASAQKPTNDKPNIIIILAEDMGFSDLGCCKRKY